MIAVSIERCISQTQAAITHWAQQVGENLYTHVALWEASFVQFDESSEAERTVRNWKVPTHYELQRIVNANADQSVNISDVFLVVHGACNAARNAEIDGRITTAQRDQVVTDWNAAFGF